MRSIYRIKSRVAAVLGRSFNTVLLVCVAALATACGNNENDKSVSEAKSAFVAERNLVDTMTLKLTSFNKEIVSNGNLLAVKRADLVFKGSGEIAKVYKKNGARVAKGDTLAVLNTKQLKLDLANAQNSLNKAELDFYDKLLGFGYGRDTANIPDDVVNVAAIRSGYIAAKHSLELAQLALDNAAVVAPFAGVVANMNLKPYEQSSDKACSVIDNSSFEVEFDLLESELGYVEVGQQVVVAPYVNLSGSYKGKIVSINPMVDDKGQVKVVAAIENRGGKLIDGMNVKIFIESRSENKLVVPKSAVVIRDGYDVLFTYNPSNSKAGWVYIEILESNSSSHVVCANKQKNAELEAGAIVITSGNLNLADGSNVEIKR